MLRRNSVGCLQVVVPLALASGMVAVRVSAAIPQYLTPNTGSGPTSTTLNGLTFVNKGLQGVGRIDASLRDQLGDTFGSVSSMQITNWAKTGSSYSGVFNTLPDRGRNDPAANLFYDYAGRIQTVPFTFTPYTGTAALGGTTVAEKKAAQNQIVATYATSTAFTYVDPLLGAAPRNTTGLNPANLSTTTLFGKPAPFVGVQGGNSINKLALDAEGLVLLPDGSGFVSDEYGAYAYRFNANKQIVNILDLPAAMLPKNNAGQTNFNSTATGTNLTAGRRGNQGLEGLAISPDGTRLFALLQSATVQDTNGSAQQTRNNTRLLTYDLTGNIDAPALISEQVVQLPTLDVDGAGGAADRTAAQSEIVALSNSQILVLARDSAGYGGSLTTPSIVKSVFLYDTTSATNVLGTASDAASGRVTVSSPSFGLNPSIMPATGSEVINMLNEAELSRFNFNLNNNNGLAFDELTFSEKWEGMGLVSAFDPENPNDYFLFIANDNDFATTNGFMKLPDGTFENYDAELNNDTIFLAYRVSIPEPGLLAVVPLFILGLRRRA